MTPAVAGSSGRPTVGALWWAIVIAAFVRLLTLGMYPLSDSTESRYAEIARKMVELNDWVTPWYDYGVPFWAKPPMSTWITAASFRLFGVNEFAARLPHFVAAVFVAWLIWQWLRRRSAREALLCTAVLCGAAVFYISAGAVMTDMMLLLGMTLAMRGFWLGINGTALEHRSNRWLLFIGLAIGLLAKGPIALVLVAIPTLVWALIAHRSRLVWKRLPWLQGSIVVTLLAAPWYGLAELRTPGFLNYFFIGEHWQRFMVAGWTGDLYGTAHAFPRGSIWLFSVVAFMPWPFLLPLAWAGRATAPARATAGAERAWRIYLFLWVLTPCVFFTFSGNVLATYVLPGVPALAMLTAAWLASDERVVRVDRVLIAGLVIVSAGVGLVVTAQHVSGGWKTTKALVRQHERLRTGDEPLIFLGTRPYSAEFYSHGQAERVTDPTALAQRLHGAPAWVALRATQSHELPDPLRARLSLEGRHGGYELFSVRR